MARARAHTHSPPRALLHAIAQDWEVRGHDVALAARGEKDALEAVPLVAEHVGRPAAHLQRELCRHRVRAERQLLTCRVHERRHLVQRHRHRHEPRRRRDVVEVHEVRNGRLPDRLVAREMPIKVIALVERVEVKRVEERVGVHHGEHAARQQRLVRLAIVCARIGRLVPLLDVVLELAADALQARVVRRVERLGAQRAKRRRAVGTLACASSCSNVAYATHRATYQRIRLVASNAH
jgi:hypothetical protein